MTAPSDLDNMIEAAEALISAEQQLAARGENVVRALLKDVDPFLEWDHYPAGEVSDPTSGAQYYYHAHPDAERGFTEHGHLHVFMHNAPDKNPKDGTADDLTHLFAISMDEHGRPQALFTLNYWMAEGVWADAAETIALLERYKMDTTGPFGLVNQWVGAVLQLYKPQIIELLHARDAKLAAAQKDYPDQDILWVKDIEVPSFLPISLNDKFLELQALATV